MSIEEQRVVAEETQKPAPVGTNRSPKSWYHPSNFVRSPLWLCLLIALLIRAWLVYHTHGIIDGDEAMVGVQAEHILRGEHPIYYYGQPYMGSLEAYLVAILFAIAGASVWALRAEPILLSLVIIWLTWKFAGILAESAKLPSNAQALFKFIAALAAAIAPLYDTVLAMRTLGGYVETFVLMLFLLISAFQLTRRWREQATNKELAWRWAGIGFIVGLGIWVNPLIGSAVIAAAIWIVSFCLSELVRLYQQAQIDKLRSALRAFLARFWLVSAAIPAGLLGLVPALRWGSIYHWENFKYLLQLGNMNTFYVNILYPHHDRLQLIHDQTIFYQKYVAPRVISGALPTESPLLASIHSFTLAVGLICISICLLLWALSFFWRQGYCLYARQLVALPLLFALCAAVTFCTSTATTAGLVSFAHDIAGRYATPLMLALPFFFAAVFTLGWLALHNLKTQSQVSADTGHMPSHKSPVKTVFTLAQLLLCLLLLVYVGLQAYTYATTDPDLTFQSASCTIAPANNDVIITYLQQEHVHYAWAITWIGNPITFKTNNGIITSDPRVVFNHTLGRIPAYTLAVLHADRPSMLTLVRHDEVQPPLLRILNDLHISYHARRFSSEPGYEVLAVTSLSRTVSLFESKIFSTAFPGCI